MAYDPDSTLQSFYVKIELTGLTLYVSTEYLTLDDGTAIDGVLVSASPLQRSAGSLLEPRVILPSMTLVFDNQPDQDGVRFSDYFADYEWANKPVTLYVGNREPAASYESVFVGKAKYPQGTSFDDETARVNVIDARSADARTLPSSTYSLSDYPNMDTTMVHQPIPIVYGDWTSTAGGGEKVPCTQVDSTVGTGGKWKIAGHAIKQIEAVYKNGASVSFTADLTNGEFTLNVAADPTTDTLTAHCQGATDDGTPTGTLLTTAPDVYNDLLQTWLDVDSGNIDSTALATWESYLTSDEDVRRVINAETDSDQMLAELLSDGFADASIVAAKYYPTYRIVSPGADLPSFYEEDLLRREGSGARHFEVTESPESVVANEVEGHFCYDPVNGSYQERDLATDDVAIARVGQRLRRTLYMPWLYKEAGGQLRTKREVFAFAGNVDMVDLGLGTGALLLRPASQFRLVYSRYAEVEDLGNPFGVRDISVDPVRRRVTMLAWDMLTLSAGTWTEDAAVTWLTATAGQRKRKGFWSDDDGYADTTVPPDEASRRYRWS